VLWIGVDGSAAPTRSRAAAQRNGTFPGIHPDTARFLGEERRIRAVGLDTPSIDHGQSKDFMTHRVLGERDIPGFENVANLDGLPPTGATVVALPMKIEGGSGGPLRIVAFVPNG
jgi:kynurenine formamidase